MTAQETNVTTAAESTLTALLSAGATTINVADTSSFPAVPFYATIDPGSDSKREVVLVDSGKTSTTFTLSSATKRGLDGTSDVAHDSGAVIAVVPVAALWTDINDRVDEVAASAVSDHGALSGLSDDDHAQYALADGSRGNFEPTGTAAAEVAAHEAEADPHPQYLTEADGNAAYADQSHAGTHQPGGSDAMAVDAAAGIGSLRTLGTGAQQAAAGDHSHGGGAVVEQGSYTGNSASSTRTIPLAMTTPGLVVVMAEDQSGYQGFLVSTEVEIVYQDFQVGGGNRGKIARLATSGFVVSDGGASYLNANGIVYHYTAIGDA